MPPVNPSTPLHTPLGVAMATLLGSVVAGAALLWLNYRALGYAALANRVAVLGVLLYLLVIGAASLLPGHPLLAVLLIAGQAGFAYWITLRLQGAALAYQRDRGVPPHAVAVSAALGLLAGMSVIVVTLALVSLTGGAGA
jgi:hypothetical protein